MKPLTKWLGTNTAINDESIIQNKILYIASYKASWQELRKPELICLLIYGNSYSYIHDICIKTP